MAVVVMAYGFGSLAGALYTPFAGFVAPELFFWLVSGRVLIMVIVGGAGTLIGPILGGIFFMLLEQQLSEVTELWPLIFGSIFIAFVMLAPDGIWGLLIKRFRAKRVVHGAGKSTLFNIITGVLPVSDGQTVFAGEMITGLPVYRVVQKGIARTFQLTHLFPDLTAHENVRIAAQAQHADRWRPLAGGHVLAATRRVADEALEQMRLSRFSGIKAGLLSHGDQRLLEIAMAIAQKPRLLMLDEPTQGLSIEETDRAVQILRDMLAKGDLTVILVEHDMEVVFKLALSLIHIS